MIILLLLGAIFWYEKVLTTVKVANKRYITGLFIFCVFLMLFYEGYVELAVGWKYGIPYDDDCGWIFRAATALADGEEWEQLHRLVLSSSYDLENRVLSLGNLGQYIYATVISIALYYPTIFDIHINLYLLYIVQILMAFSASLNLTDALVDEMNVELRKRAALSRKIFLLLVMCPVVFLSAVKLLRDIWFISTTMELVSLVLREKGKLKKSIAEYIILSFIGFLLRPHIAVLIIPLLVYYIFNKKIGNIVNCLILGILLIGSNVISLAVKFVGWNYSVGKADLMQAVHLLLFPNPVNQLNEVLKIADNPSWSTILYFSQAIWNIICLPIAAIGFFQKGKDRFFWIVLFFNCLIFYTIPYDIENMTPRYKLIFLIPLMYFIAKGIAFLKRKIRIVVR